MDPAKPGDDYINFLLEEDGKSVSAGGPPWRNLPPRSANGHRRYGPRVLFAVAGVALCVAAYLRGDYLLGPSCGVTYAIITVGLLGLLVRSKSLTRTLAVILFSLAAGYVMAWPASISPDLQHFINKQALDRAARAELAAVFASDPAFCDLSTSAFQVKVVNITIQGTLDKRDDLDRLRTRIKRECPTIRWCIVHWDVALRDAGFRVIGQDRELFEKFGKR